MIPYILAVLASLVSGCVSLCMLVLLLASAPNSKPDQWAQIKLWMILVGVIALVGIAGAVWAMIVKRPTLAAGVGVFPAVFVVVLFVVLLKTQG